MSVDMFPEAEFRARIARAQTLMEVRGIDALLFSSEANIRYFTGYYSQRWLQSTSPECGVLTCDGDLTLILPTIEMYRAATHPWLRDMREATGEPGQGFVDRIADVLQGAGTRIGAELGAMTRINLTIREFQALQLRLPKHKFADGSDIFWDLRKIKSDLEVRAIRRALYISETAFQTLRASTRAGMTEKELHGLIAAEFMRGGADRIGSIPLGFRSPSTQIPEDSHLRIQSDRAAQNGDMIWLDVGAVVDGYWSDTFRQYTLGEGRPNWRAAYRVIHACFEAALDALRPGTPTRDAMRAYEQVLRQHGYDAFVTTRLQKGSLAHSIGPDLLEPPIIDQSDTPVFEPGMVFTIEPFLYTPETGFIMIEEQVLVNQTGPEVLSHRAPPELPEA